MSKSRAEIQKFVEDNFHTHQDWADTWVECNRGIYSLDDLSDKLYDFISD